MKTLFFYIYIIPVIAPAFSIMKEIWLKKQQICSIFVLTVTDTQNKTQQKKKKRNVHFTEIIFAALSADAILSFAAQRK